MKKHISDLLDTFSDPNIELETSTPLSSERIKALTMSKIKKNAPLQRHTTFRVLMAAAIISALALSAFAATSGAAWFQAFFESENRSKLSSEQMALIEQNAVAIDQSQTVDGYTIHVDSVLYDERKIYVKLDLYAPEGVVLPYGDNRIFEKIALYTNDGNQISSGWGFGESIDEDKTDNHVEMLLTLDVDPGIETGFLQPDSGARLELTNLTKTTFATFFSRKKETLAAGTWQFDLRFAATRKDLWAREIIEEPVPCTMVRYHTGEETEIILTSICLRALSIDVVYDYPDGADLERLDWMGTTLVKYDGTAIRVFPSSDTFGPDGDTITGCLALEPMAPIVPEEIAYIQFSDGTQIPVNTEE